jgi:MFS transporter, NNP family, nitrate/nitrite transporter
MIGEIGALGGFILPNLLGQSKQHTGSYKIGFIIYAALAFVILIMMRLVAKNWMQTWVGVGGRALTEELDISAVAGD